MVVYGTSILPGGNAGDDYYRTPQTDGPEMNNPRTFGGAAGDPSLSPSPYLHRAAVIAETRGRLSSRFP